MPTKTPSKLIIAIDGPAGSGKSTIAKLVARKMKLPFIDSGAMYRAVTLKAIQSGKPLTDTANLVACAKKAHIEFKNQKNGNQRVYLDGHDVSRAIRTPELTQNVYYAAQEPRVRTELVSKQRKLGRTQGAVMEGRDITTVVFPNADFKIYLDAPVPVRARRRYKELVEAGKKVRYADVLKELKVRDHRDKTRKTGALKRAKGAIYYNTGKLTLWDNVDRILTIVSGPRAKKQS